MSSPELLVAGKFIVNVLLDPVAVADLSICGGVRLTEKLLLVPVAVPSVALIVTLDPVPVKVTEPVQTPFDQPVVPVDAGLIVGPPLTERPTELLKPVMTWLF